MSGRVPPDPPGEEEGGGRRGKGRGGSEGVGERRGKGKREGRKKWDKRASRQYFFYTLSTVYMYFRLMTAIFDLLVIPTSEIIYISPSVLLNTENVGVAVGISLLSCIQAEIFVIAYVLPVFGGYL